MVASATKDFAVAPDTTTGRLTLHAVDCPLVRAQAERGDPVMTLFGCERDPDPDMPHHNCLHLEAPR